MRLLLGIILGCLLTVGTAYVADYTTSGGIAGAEQRPMVNWDVVAKNMQELSSRARQQWSKLTSG